MTKSEAITFLVDSDRMREIIANQIKNVLLDLGLSTFSYSTDDDEKFSELQRKGNMLMLKQAEAEVVLGFNQLRYELN